MNQTSSQAQAIMSTIAKNLRRLRVANGLEETELADRASLSLDDYRSMEEGNSTPSMAALRAVAAALDVPWGRLVETVHPLSKVRFRAKENLPDREQILADVRRWFYSFSEIEDMLKDRKPYKLDKIHEQLAAVDNDPIQSAALARRELGLQEDEPISNIRTLLESSGIKVGEVKWPLDSFFGLSVADEKRGPAIIVNTWEEISVERWIFTAAHELGHLILHSSDYSDEQVEEPKKQEQEADKFASAFLMPNGAFEREWISTNGLAFVDRVLKIKLIFNVSYRTVLFRLGEKYPEINLWARFHWEFKARTGRSLSRSTEPRPLAEETFSELLPIHSTSCRLNKLVRKAVEEGEISVGRGAEVLEISLHDMRELMESWVD